MNRLLELYAQQRTHPTNAEICRNLILDLLRNGKEDVVCWRNPEALEFEVVNESELKHRLYIRTGKCFRSILDEGMKFVRKVPGQENVFRFHFIPKYLLQRIPRKIFFQVVRFSSETSV